ncbi:hypothetical protein C8T65DRAFT_228684 [Cerioporus squamosus]|nr:hypothetical protein C8T65DRAFT_228684 [Cerioporus squamosus]
MADPQRGMSGRAKDSGEVLARRKQTYGRVIDMQQPGSVQHIASVHPAGRTKVEVSSARYAPPRRYKALGAAWSAQRWKVSSMTAVHNAGPGVPVCDLRHQGHHALSGENQPYLRCFAVPSRWLLHAAGAHDCATAVVRCMFSAPGHRSVDQQVGPRSRSSVQAWGSRDLLRLQIRLTLKSRRTNTSRCASRMPPTLDRRSKGLAAVDVVCVFRLSGDAAGQSSGVLTIWPGSAPPPDDRSAVASSPACCWSCYSLAGGLLTRSCGPSVSVGPATSPGQYERRALLPLDVLVRHGSRPRPPNGLSALPRRPKHTSNLVYADPDVWPHARSTWNPVSLDGVCLSPD